MKFYLASIISIIANTSNSYYLVRGRLESHLYSNHRQGLGIQLHPKRWQDSGFYSFAFMFSSSTDVFIISEVIFLLIESSATGYSVWYKYRCHASIKESKSTTRRLYKYTCEVIVFIVLTEEER